MSQYARSHQETKSRKPSANAVEFVNSAGDGEASQWDDWDQWNWSGAESWDEGWNWQPGEADGWDQWTGEAEQGWLVVEEESALIAVDKYPDYHGCVVVDTGCSCSVSSLQAAWGSPIAA